MFEFTSKLIHLRLDHPNLHRRKFFQDRVIRGSVVKDIAWCNTDGNEFSDEAWSTGWNRALAVMLNGKTLAITDEEGRPIYDDSFLIMVNASHEGAEFVLPPAPAGTRWMQLLDTENGQNPFAKVRPRKKVILGGRSLRVYREHPAR